MRILYLSQYFPPEAGATQTRAFEMARNIVRLGAQVTVLAEIPNHPSGIIPPAYRGRLYERAGLEGIDVIRVWVKASPVKSFSSRMAFYLSYMAGAIAAGTALARGRYDLVYASSPPLFVGGAGLALSSLKRAPLVFEVRDLWPASAVALGELKNRPAIALAARLEEACYRRARKIVLVSQSQVEELRGRGIPESKLALIPNGANVDLFRFKPEGRARLRAELGLRDDFVAVYAGIFGVAQGLETVVEAARLLQSERGLRILLVGEGPRKADLAALVNCYNLDNLHILPEQPRERMPDFLSAADLALIPLRKLEIFKGARPSKIFDAWACERPVIAGVEGEARQLVEEAGAGLVVTQEDPAALADAILNLRGKPTLRQVMGTRGRAFTEASYSRQAQAETLFNLLKEIAAET
jgi:colanic acid biosynthesis glycosyl transferase WcaI